jgi:hypothetical protein
MNDSSELRRRIPEPYFSAHRLCQGNRALLEKADACACFDCQALIRPVSVLEWIDDESTGRCPKCGMDTLLPENDQYELTPPFLKGMKRFWLGGSGTLVNWESSFLRAEVLFEKTGSDFHARPDRIGTHGDYPALLYRYMERHVDIKGGIVDLLPAHDFIGGAFYSSMFAVERYPWLYMQVGKNNAALLEHAFKAMDDYALRKDPADLDVVEMGRFLSERLGAKKHELDLRSYFCGSETVSQKAYREVRLYVHCWHDAVRDLTPKESGRLDQVMEKRDYFKNRTKPRTRRLPLDALSILLLTDIAMHIRRSGPGGVSLALLQTHFAGRIGGRRKARVVTSLSEAFCEEVLEFTGIERLYFGAADDPDKTVLRSQPWFADPTRDSILSTLLSRPWPTLRTEILERYFRGSERRLALYLADHPGILRWGAEELHALGNIGPLDILVSNALSAIEEQMRERNGIASVAKTRRLVSLARGEDLLTYGIDTDPKFAEYLRCLTCAPGARWPEFTRGWRMHGEEVVLDQWDDATEVTKTALAHKERHGPSRYRKADPFRFVGEPMIGETPDDFRVRRVRNLVSEDESYYCWKCHRRIGWTEFEQRKRQHPNSDKIYTLDACGHNGCDGILTHLDDYMAPYIFRLNAMGFVTGHCCEGHPSPSYAEPDDTMHILFEKDYPEIRAALSQVAEDLKRKYPDDATEQKPRIRATLFCQTRLNICSTDYRTEAMRLRAWRDLDALMTVLQSKHGPLTQGGERHVLR